MALNEYADMTPAEFASFKMGSRLGGGLVRNDRKTDFKHKDVNAPAAVDWRKKGDYGFMECHTHLY